MPQAQTSNEAWLPQAGGWARGPDGTLAQFPSGEALPEGWMPAPASAGHYPFDIDTSAPTPAPTSAPPPATGGSAAEGRQPTYEWSVVGHQ